MLYLTTVHIIGLTRIGNTWLRHAVNPSMGARHPHPWGLGTRIHAGDGLNQVLPIPVLGAT